MIPCAPIACTDFEDLPLYSLQDAPLGRLNCPPGFVCNSDTINMNCCGVPLFADLSGMTDAQRAQTIDALVKQCAILNLPCNGGTPGDKFYNTPQSCSVKCPDGTIFTHTIPAGAFLADSVDDANALALAACKAELPSSIICIGNLSSHCGCVGQAFSATLRTTSTPKAFHWEIHGLLPPGLSASTGIAGSSLVIAGTPTTNGQYTFTVSALDGSGNNNSKTFTITILEITTASPLPAPATGVPYSQQLTVAGGSGNYLWRISSGTLPDGLTFSNTGLISGTPTGL